MPHYVVAIPGHPERSVQAPNMLAALGDVVDAIGGDIALDRLVCDLTRNGVMLARRAGSDVVFRVEPREVSAEAGTDMFALPLGQDEDDDDLAAWDLSVEVQPLDETLEDIDYAEVFDYVDLQIDVYRTITDKVEVVRTAPTVAEAWQRALALAHELIACEAGSGLRRDPDGFLRFAIATGPRARQVANLQIPAGSGIAGFCIERVAAVLIRDPAGDPRFYRTIDKVSGFSTRALICSPIARGRTALGCLQLLNPTGGKQFSDMDLDLLSQIAVGLADRLLDPAEPGA